jgi:hypothetical protein
MGVSAPDEDGMSNEVESLRARVSELESGIRALAEKWGKDSDESYIEPEDAGDEEQYLVRSTRSEVLGDCHDSLMTLLKVTP